MKIDSVHLNDIKVISMEAFEDERGFFMETYHKEKFKALGIEEDFVQDNHSRSVYGTVRGLHFQWYPRMGKLMRVTQGSAFLVAVDIRKDSPWLGQWFGEVVTAQNKKMIWAPAGFARGFQALSSVAEIQYKCTGGYNKQAESGILWNDPEIGIEWPLFHNPAMLDTNSLIISEKDRTAQTLSQWLKNPISEVFKI